MKKKILEFIRKYQMIRPGDSVCVGFSGGADSVCLLELLYELREELSIRLEAVHVNHNLRGRESDGDQDFAEEFCRKRGIPLHLYSFEVKKMAGNLGCGLEEAGRQARRNAYGDCVRRLGGARIALAHHQNDLAETLLFHLSRGTSLEGMAALRPVRGQVIRPLLCVSRKEIEEELRRRRDIPRLQKTVEAYGQHVALFDDACGDVDETALPRDARLYPGEHADSALIVCSGDLPLLCSELSLRLVAKETPHPVVGNGDLFKTELRSAARLVEDGASAVARAGVHMVVAEDLHRRSPESFRGAPAPLPPRSASALPRQKDHTPPRAP